MMITINGAVVAAVIAAVIAGVIVHLVDKKHETREVARLKAKNAELEGNVAEVAKNSENAEKEISLLKKLLDEAQGYTDAKAKVFDCPTCVPSGLTAVSNNVFLKDDNGKLVMYVNEKITLTDNQKVVLKDEKTSKVYLYYYTGSYDGMKVTPDEKNK